MTRISKIYFGVLLGSLSAVMFIGCNANKSSQQDVESKASTVVYDSTYLYIDANEVDSAWVLYTDDETRKEISPSDMNRLSELLLTAKYDTVWNRGDIMFKMVAQDYTLILRGKGKTADEDEWVPLWKEEGRTKYKNKWFSIPAKEREEVYKLLDNYRK